MTQANTLFGNLYKYTYDKYVHIPGIEGCGIPRVQNKKGHVCTSVLVTAANCPEGIGYGDNGNGKWQS